MDFYLFVIFFVFQLFGCSAGAQITTSRQMKGQFLSANLSFAVGVMSAMYLCMGVSGKNIFNKLSLGSEQSCIIIFGKNCDCELWIPLNRSVLRVQQCSLPNHCQWAGGCHLTQPTWGFGASFKNTSVEICWLLKCNLPNTTGCIYFCHYTIPTPKKSESYLLTLLS